MTWWVARAPSFPFQCWFWRWIRSEKEKRLLKVELRYGLAPITRALGRRRGRSVQFLGRTQQTTGEQLSSQLRPPPPVKVTVSYSDDPPQRDASTPRFGAESRSQQVSGNKKIAPEDGEITVGQNRS